MVISNQQIEFQDCLHNMLTWFLSPKSTCLDKEDRYVLNMIAENITLGYKNLFFKTKPSKIKYINIEELNELEYINRDEDYLKPVIELKRFANIHLKDYLIDFLVHGSIATLDYAKGWSDFDTYLILRNNVAGDKDLLLELRQRLLDAYNFLLKIDPQQHHGFLLCTENDLSNYPCYYMPAEVLHHAKSLFRNGKIILRQIDTKDRQKLYFKNLTVLFEESYNNGEFRRHPYNSAYLLAEFKNADNGLYQFKNYIGYLAIAPAYFLLAKGSPAYKKDAFKAIKRYLSEDKQELMDRITTIRSEWPKKERFPYEGNKIPQWVRDLMGKDYFKEGYEFISALNDVQEFD